MSKRIALLSAAAFSALALTSTFVAPARAEEKTVMVGGAAMFPSKNIIQNAVNSKDHTTLVAAVKAAGLVETLEGKGPFTVFAPTNAAFGKLPAGTVDTLVKPENKATLTKILTYHVVAGKLDASDLTDGKKLKTVEGEELTVKKADGKIWIIDAKGDQSMVTISNVHQSNGVIHVVDTVLMPARNAAYPDLPTSPNGMRDGEPGNPGSLFCERDAPAAHRPFDGSMAVTKPPFPAYMLSYEQFERRRQPCPALPPPTTMRTPEPAESDPAGLGAGHALDQRGRDDPDDHVGLADLQRLAAVRFPLLAQHHARRLARRRAALAFRRDVAVDGQWPRLSHHRPCHRPLPQEAAADHARGRDRPTSRRR